MQHSIRVTVPMILFALVAITSGRSLSAAEPPPKTTTMQQKNEFWQKQYKIEAAEFETRAKPFFSSMPVASTNDDPNGIFYRYIVDGKNMLMMDCRVSPAPRQGWTLVEIRFPQISAVGEHKKAARIIFQQLEAQLVAPREPDTPKPAISPLPPPPNPGILYADGARGTRLVGGTATDIGVIDKLGMYVTIDDREYLIPRELALKHQFVQAGQTDVFAYQTHLLKCRKLILVISTEPSAAGCNPVLDMFVSDSEGKILNSAFQPLVKSFEIATPINGLVDFSQLKMECPTFKQGASQCTAQVEKTTTFTAEARPVGPITLTSLDQITSGQQNGKLPPEEQVILESQYRTLLMENIGNRFTVEKLKYNTPGSPCAITLKDGKSLVEELPGDCATRGPDGTPLLPTTRGSIWRIVGTTESLAGYVFTSDANDPLRFVQIPDKGLVYMFGTGEVTTNSGEKIALHTVVSAPVPPLLPVPDDEPTIQCAKGTVKKVADDGKAICQEVVTTPTDEADNKAAANTDIVAQPSTRSPARALKIAGIVSMSTGLATAGTGIVLGIAALKKDEDLKNTCVDGFCTVEQTDEIQKRDNMAKASSVMIIAGSSIAAAGITLFIIGKVKEKRQKQAQTQRKSQIGLAPLISESGTGILLHGQF